MTVSYGTVPIQKKNNSSPKDIIIKVVLVLVTGSMAWVLLVSVFEMRTRNAKKPHIILIIADDLGWDDVSFHGSPLIPTPNIDALAASGIILNKHYVTPWCTPSRASLMTGRYPSNTGLQHGTIDAGYPIGLPLNFTILPQHLKRLGYATHLVGKWNLGYHRKEYTPTYRGFDSFFGYWNGYVDYYDYTHYSIERMWGVDLHDGTKPVLDLRNKYSVELFTEKAEEVIRNHDASQPLFLLLAQSAPHIGNSYQRFQAPPRHVAKFKHIKDVRRRFHAGAISTLDESTGSVFSALDSRGFLDNSIIVFFSDNGGETEDRDGRGSNWPLRGCKGFLWEGGVRVPAFIWSPLLQVQTPGTRMDMMHISDWLPTLYSAAGGDVKDLSEIDGINMWRHLVSDLPSPRTEILLNIDQQHGMYSLIQGDLKLVNGTYLKDNRTSWYGSSGRENFSVSSMDEWVWKNGSVVRNILQKAGKWPLKAPDHWRQKVFVKCARTTGEGVCNLKANPCLFNITEDPCEENNLASQQPQVVKQMMDRIWQLNSKSLESILTEEDPKADPRCHGFAYVSWLDAEHLTECYGLS